jgi:hypothetical protein
MSETTLCGYCVELPEKARTVAHRVSRCPLCKAELGVTGMGRQFRVVDRGLPPARRATIVTALMLATVAGSLALLSWIVSRPGRPVEVAVVATPVRLEPVSPEVTPVPVERVDPVVVKRRMLGVLSPDARAKPQPGTIDASPSRLEVALGPDAAKVNADLPTTAPRYTAIVRVPSALATHHQADALARQGEQDLLAAPELALLPELPANDAKRAKQEISRLAREIIAANTKEHDGFIRGLRQKRSDLAGLPFRMGKDCQTSAEQAQLLARSAAAIRTSLGLVLRPQPSASATLPYSDAAPEAFWIVLGQVRSGNGYDVEQLGIMPMLPVLLQILGPEQPGFRLGLIARYRDMPQAAVTASLTRLSLYDPDVHVRNKAMQALYDRPSRGTTELFLEALRYPWAPVAQRAADALVTLGRQDLVRRLVDALDGPDPAAPFETVVDGKKVWAVRELVKVNHHKNCLLCHAPTASRERTRDVPFGAVPTPGEDLPPPLSTAYYSRGDSVAVARADVTYLRQDFSILAPVNEAGPWPKLQRFDYLVRTRVLTDAELRTVLQQRAGGPASVSPQRLAVLSALRALTRTDAGHTTAAWQRALAVTSP